MVDPGSLIEGGSLLVFAGVVAQTLRDQHRRIGRVEDKSDKTASDVVSIKTALQIRDGIEI